MVCWRLFTWPGAGVGATSAGSGGRLPVAGPLETVRAMAVAGATEVPAAGSWPITVSSGTVSLLWRVTAPTVRPAPVMAASAAVWVCPATSGTLTVAGVTSMVTLLGGLSSRPSLTISWAT